MTRLVLSPFLAGYSQWQACSKQQTHRRYLKASSRAMDVNARHHGGRLR